MALALTYAAASHVGLVRGNNEDSAYAGPHLLALSDGMGGHAAGEIASQLMISHLAQVDTDGPQEDMAGQLVSAMVDGNEAIASEVEDHPETEGMGCTLDAFLFNGDKLVICHVGDSRGYVYRDGQLEQITKDDTFVQSLVDEGKLAPEDVSSHPQRSLILKALTGRPVEPTLITRDVHLGDRYLLCSDGLSDPVSADTIRDILSRGTIVEAAQRLIDLALRSGGPDNVTVVLGEVVDPDEPGVKAPTAPIVVGALNPDQVDVARPDTAAGRAVGMKLTQAKSTPKPAQPQPDSAGAAAGAAGVAAGAGSAAAAGAHNGSNSVNAADSRTDSPTEAEGEPDEESESPHTSKTKKRKSGRLGLTVGLVILVIAGLVGAGAWWAKSTLSNQYYIAATDSQQLHVYQGAKESILGIKLNRDYQKTCLDRQGKLKLADINASSSSCSPFALTDLPPAVRSSVDNLPAGKYEDIQNQLERLASQALPVCVTRQPQTSDSTQPSGSESASAEASAQPETTSPSAEPTATDAATQASESEAPGQPGDLTTPGVSCREVK